MEETHLLPYISNKTTQFEYSNMAQRPQYFKCNMSDVFSEHKFHEKCIGNIRQTNLLK